MSQENLKNISFPIQITTLVTIVVFCGGLAITGSMAYSDFNFRLDRVEESLDKGERFTQEEADVLEDKIDMKLNRIEGKLDTLILQK